MEILISTNPKFTTFIPSLPYKNCIFLNFQNPKPFPIYYNKTTSCSCSPNYSGWAELSSGDDSGESNQLSRLLNSFGIDEKKYAFVYLLGFLCALAVSRVKVSSIIVFPACFLVFAVGFSFGIANKVDFKKKRFKADEFRVSIENLRDLLNGFDVKIVNLKNCMRKDVDCNRISKSDLVSYIEDVESIEEGLLQAKSVIQGYMDSMIVDALNQKPGDRKKEVKGKGFGISWIIAGFRDRSFGSRPGKVKDTVKNDSCTNIMSPIVEDKIVKPVTSDNKNTNNDGDVRIKETYEGKAMGRMARINLMEMENSNKQVFDRDDYIIKDNNMRFMKNNNLVDDGFLDSDFGASLKHRKTEAYFQQEQGSFTKINGNDMLYDNLESSEKEVYNEPQYENGFASSPSSEISNDILFNDCITEANSLLKQSRELLRHRGIEEDAENMLYKSTELLSKAVDMKPMSLLAVGQLGNTYLLHGELKLKHSRKLRALLAQSDSNVLERLEDEFSNRETFVDYLVYVCEECEELLVKAGRKYRLALSIDGNDMRALYNWGLALSFRAQLISDIGPEAALDADKVYMAAIDKFNAMMSKSNSLTPDALFRWGVVLQQRSRLRTRNFREKVKLLSQAKRLYEDALLMDSNNSQVKEALSTCVSELRYNNYD